MDIILTNNDASYCLMELIQTSNFQVVKRAMKILHDAVLYRVKEGNSELIQTLWDIIPQALARLNTFHTSLQVANVGALLQLACLTIPTNLSASAVVRASYLLTRVLVRQSTLNTDTPLTFYKAAIHHAFILLLKSVELHDKRTLSIYVSEQKFLEVLHTGIASKHPEIRSISTYFLSHLLHYQSEQGYLDCDNSIAIESKEILQLLKDDDMDVVTGSLQLLFNLLQSKVASPVARLTDKGHDTVSSEFLQTLFIKLQSMCAKNFSEASWRCLGAILSASASNFAEQNIQLHLATQPWIYFLIRVKRCTVSASGSHYFLYFISQWLQCLRSRNISNRSSTVRVVFKKERALCPNLLSETLSVVVTMMLNFTDLGSFSNGTKQLVLQIMCLLLENEVDLPEKTSEAIRHRLEVIQSS
ncbi:uncharacterized protein [Periplaneta americana]|uniref:uncharacterized protein n=1 Tax=Periplaneta americana TaxID=6978 RepID=UPI0037E94355